MRKGFTLTEALVVLAIVVLAMGAVMAATSQGYKLYRFVSEHATAVTEARSGVRTMVRELRQAQEGEDGSYPLEKAGDKELVFYTDEDGDGEAERVRYFLGGVNSGSKTKDCVTLVDGGSCGVTFSNFFSGTLESASLEFAVEGDVGWSQETAAITADGSAADTLCQGNQCSDCRGDWEDSTSEDVTDAASDNTLDATADATAEVDAWCDWEEDNHSLKAQFVLTWTASGAGDEGLLKKGVIQPTGSPPRYPESDETVSIISRYVRNAPPIFTYYDENGNELETTPARIADTKSMEVLLIVNEDTATDPQPVEIRSRAHMRNL